MSSLFLLDCNLCKLAAHNSFGFLIQYFLTFSVNLLTIGSARRDVSRFLCFCF